MPGLGDIAVTETDIVQALRESWVGIWGRPFT